MSQQQSLDAHIPLDKEVFVLRDLLHKAGYELKVVGGAVRDYLFHAFSNNPNGRYKPKDIDLVTDASPRQLIQALSTPAADAYHIQTLPIGEQFGVIMVNFLIKNDDGSLDFKKYEIATYREDIGGDGRRPDDVKFTSVENDAGRRDLTMNALYYDIPNKPNAPGKIVDYNNGQGIEDIKNGVARPIGNPEERFTEDNLRVMRLIRFFCRYNSGGPEIIEQSDPDTAKALKKFSAMPHVSPERISAEFLSGLRSSLSPVNYLKCLHHFNIMERMFPGLKINTQFDKLYNLQQDASMMRNPKIILAFLLKNNTPQQIQNVLTSMAYPVQKGNGDEYKLVPNILFLVKMLSFKPSDVYDLSKELERVRPPAKVSNGITDKDILKYAETHNKEILAWSVLFGLDINTITNFTQFQRTVTSHDPRLNGAQGRELGQAIKDLEIRNFLDMGKETKKDK